MLNPALNLVPDRVQHIHLMGICGTAMAALAGMLKERGFQVSGSDNNVYPPMSDFLENLGIPICKGYHPENLQRAIDLVVVGNVITKKNPEAISLADLQLPYISLPQALAHFFIAQKRSLVVSGTHGKTTTSSLLASCLVRADRDPGFMIGGIVQEFQANFRIGQGEDFVVEGDEYDTAFFDKESKFLHYRPKVAILTSIEFDHADIFADLEAILRMFRKFVRLLPADGLLVAHLDDPRVAEIAALASCPVAGYGTGQQNTWQLGSIAAEGPNSRFTVHKDGEVWGKFPLAMSGRHNCLNALAVCVVLDHLGLDRQQIAHGLASFGGVKRRQEVRGEAGGVLVIDDFAHHPTAVKETLAALKAAYPERRLVTVFEPRTNSSRRAIFQTDYAAAFANAATVILREPLPLEGFATEQLFSSRQLAADLNARQIAAQAFDDTDQILKYLAAYLRPGDLVAVLSNGGFDNIHNRLLAQLSV